MRWKQLNPLSLGKLVKGSAAAAESEMVVDDPNNAGRRPRGRPRKNVPTNTSGAGQSGKAAALGAGSAGRPRKAKPALDAGSASRPRKAEVLDTGSAGRPRKAAALDTGSAGRPRKAAALDPVRASGGTSRRYDFRRRGAEQPQYTAPHVDNSEEESLDSEGDSEYAEEDQPKQGSRSDSGDEESSGRGDAGSRSNNSGKRITKRVASKPKKVDNFGTPESELDSGGNKRKAGETNQHSKNGKGGDGTDGSFAGEVIKRRAVSGGDSDAREGIIRSNQSRPGDDREDINHDRLRAKGDINSQGSIRDRIIRRQLLLMDPIMDCSTLEGQANVISSCRSTDAVGVNNVACGSSVSIRDIATAFQRKDNEKSVGDIWARLNYASQSHKPSIFAKEPQKSVEGISQSTCICTSKAATFPASSTPLENNAEEIDSGFLVSQRRNDEQESCFSPFGQCGESNLSKNHAGAMIKIPSKTITDTTKQALHSFRDSENFNGEESCAAVHTKKDHMNSIHSIYHSGDVDERSSNSIIDKIREHQRTRKQALQSIHSFHDSEDVNREESDGVAHTVIDHMSNNPSSRNRGDATGTISDTISNIRKKISQNTMGTTKQALQSSHSFRDSENFNVEESCATVHTMKGHMNHIYPVCLSEDVDKIRQNHSRKQAPQSIHSFHDSEDVNSEESHEAAHTVVYHMKNIPSNTHSGDAVGPISDTISNRRKQLPQNIMGTAKQAPQCNLSFSDSRNFNGEKSCAAVHTRKSYLKSINSIGLSEDVDEISSRSVIDKIRQNQHSRKQALQNIHSFHDFEDINSEESHGATHTVIDQLSNIPSDRHCGDAPGTVSDTLSNRRKHLPQSRTPTLQKRFLYYNVEDMNDEESSPEVFKMADHMNITHTSHRGAAAGTISETVVDRRKQYPQSRKQTLQRMADQMNTFYTTHQSGNMVETLSTTFLAKTGLNSQSRKFLQNREESCAAVFTIRDRTDNAHCARHSEDASEIISNTIVDKRSQNSQIRKEAIYHNHSVRDSKDLNGKVPHTAVSTMMDHMINTHSNRHSATVLNVVADEGKQNPQCRKEALRLQDSEDWNAEKSHAAPFEDDSTDNIHCTHHSVDVGEIISITMVDNIQQNSLGRSEPIQSNRSFHGFEDINGEDPHTDVSAMKGHMTNMHSTHHSGPVSDTAAEKRTPNAHSRNEVPRSIHLVQDSEDLNHKEAEAALFTTIGHVDDIHSAHHPEHVRETLSNTIPENVQIPHSRKQALQNGSFFHDSEHMDIEESSTAVSSMKNHMKHFLGIHHSGDVRKSVSDSMADKRKHPAQSNKTRHSSEDLSGEDTPAIVQTLDPHTNNTGSPLSGVPPDTNVDEAVASLPKKRGRGYSTGAKFWSKTKGRKVPITLSANGDPVGPTRKDLVIFLGIIARNSHFLPMNCVDWRKISIERKNEIWKFVQSKFIIGIRARKAVLEIVARCWTTFRAIIKQEYYKPCDNYHDRVANCPPRVDPSHWKFLVDYWESEEGQRVSATNKENRKLQKTRHTSGPRTHSSIAADLQQRNGRKISRWELFQATHVKKDGSPADPKSAEIIEKMKAATANKDDITNEDEVFDQILGPRKRAHHAKDEAYDCDNAYVGDLESALKAQKQEMEELMKNQQLELLDLRERQKQMEVAIRSLHSPNIPDSTPDLENEFRTPAFQKKYSTSQPNSVDRQKDSRTPVFQKKLATGVSTISQPNFVEGQEVNLLSFDDTTMLVAQGEIVSTDSTMSIGGTVLGPRFLALYIDVVIEPDEPLVRPYAKYEKIEDSLGAVIAWPIKFISSR